MGKLFKLALEGAVVEEPSIVENVPVEEAVQNAEELAKTDSEIQQDIAAVEQLVEEKTRLEEQVTANDEKLENPDAVVSVVDVEVSEETRTEVQYALGYTSGMNKIRLSQESVFNDVRSNPRKYLAISNEDIKDTIKKIWEKIKAFFRKIAEALGIKKKIVVVQIETAKEKIKEAEKEFKTSEIIDATIELMKPKSNEKLVAFLEKNPCFVYIPIDKITQILIRSSGNIVNLARLSGELFGLIEYLLSTNKPGSKVNRIGLTKPEDMLDKGPDLRLCRMKINDFVQNNIKDILPFNLIEPYFRDLENNALNDLSVTLDKNKLKLKPLGVDTNSCIFAGMLNGQPSILSSRLDDNDINNRNFDILYGLDFYEFKFKSPTRQEIDKVITELPKMNNHIGTSMREMASLNLSSLVGTTIDSISKLSTSVQKIADSRERYDNPNIWICQRMVADAQRVINKYVMPALDCSSKLYTKNSQFMCLVVESITK